jgi:hypothetical protein
MQIQLTDAERDLFKLCTTITVGNGAKTSFWKDRWIKGCAPQDNALECFRLTWRKNKMVAAVLPNGRWMRGLRRLESEVGLRQFDDLWAQLSQVHLSSVDDTIAWRFTTNGTYSAQSAYNVQFTGTVRDGPWNTIWKAKVESKCRFFHMVVIAEQAANSGSSP